MTPWRPTSWLSRIASHQSLRTRRARLVVDALGEAWQRSDEAALTALLVPDAAVLVDGGDAAVAVERAVGAGAVARALVRVLDAYPGATVHDAEVNGTPGLLLRVAERVCGVAAVDVRGRRVRDVWIVVNPEKLTHWNR